MLFHQVFGQYLISLGNILFIFVQYLFLHLWKIAYDYSLFILPSPRFYTNRWMISFWQRCIENVFICCCTTNLLVFSPSLSLPYFFKFENVMVNFRCMVNMFEACESIFSVYLAQYVISIYLPIINHLKCGTIVVGHS